MAYEGGRVALDLRPVSSLLPHEETIESKTQEIAAQLRKDGVQRDPLIVDRRTRVVLDGMHRLSAFVTLGIGHAVCSMADYASPDISLSRWSRVYTFNESHGARDMIEEVGLAGKSSRKEALVRLERRETSMAAFVGGDAYLPAASGGIDEGFGLIRKVDQLAQARRWERSFVEEDEVDIGSLKEKQLAVFVPRFEKRDVLEAGLSRRPFPCKTSLHVVDPRPVAVGIPLDELESGSIDTLDGRLDKGHFRMLPPNSVYEGRKYRERLLMLNTE